MQNKSRALLDKLLSNETILYANRVYSTFLKIPAHILNSNDKIILIQFKMLSILTELQSSELFDWNHEAISQATGIPLGTVNRCMPQLIEKMPAVSEYMQQNCGGEMIEISTVRKVGFATIYNVVFTEPSIKRSFTAAGETPQVEKHAPLRNSESSRGIEKKMQVLRQTGFDDDDLKKYLRFTIERIKRNTEYFKQQIELHPDKTYNSAYFDKTMTHDYGHSLLDDRAKMTEYFELILHTSGLIRGQFTQQQFNEVFEKSFHYPPASLAVVNKKADLIQLFDSKYKLLSDTVQKQIVLSVEKYYNLLKFDDRLYTKTPDKIRQLLKHAILQLFFTVIDTKIANKQAA